MEDGPSRSFSAILKLIDGCDNRCVFCSEAPEKISKLAVAEARSLIDAVRARGADRIVFSGGEPTVHAGLEELIAHARGAGFSRITVFSNGRKFKDEAYARSLRAAGLDSALVSLHGPDEDSHAQVTGIRRGFGETLDGIGRLVEQGIDVTVNTVVTRLNYRRLEAHVDFVAARFAGRVRLQISDLFPTLRVLSNPWLHVPYHELGPVLRSALTMASCRELPCCTVLFPLCVLDPFFMDALELREEEADSLVGGEGFPDPVWKKPEFRFHRYYPGFCRRCSFFGICAGISKGYGMDAGDRGIFRPYHGLDPAGCLAANRERDRDLLPRTLENDLK